jgi:hypothetical protein
MGYTFIIIALLLFKEPMCWFLTYIIYIFTQITQLYLHPWEYWCSEYHIYALQYQFVVSVGTGEILHFSGPFKGAVAGVTIACQTILH